MLKSYEYYIPSLSEYPSISTNTGLNQFTEGDLHGNALRLIESLIHFGVIDVSDSEYKKIVSCYAQALRDPKNTANNLALLALIKTIRVKNPSFLVRLIGDTLADRTGNDLFMLGLVDYLITNGCHIRILISNHDIHFMTAVMGVSSLRELKERSLRDGFFFPYGQGISFLRLVDSVERGEMSLSQLQRTVKNYFSTFLLLDYAVSADGELEIFSHAPINLGTLRDLGEQFKVAYPGDASSNEEKIAFINALNTVFRVYVQHGDPHILERVFDEESYTAASKLVWQRENNHAFIDKSFPVVNVYGHDKSLATAPDAKVIRLDNTQGKGSLGVNAREHSVFATNSSISPLPLLTEADIQEELRVYGGGSRRQTKPVAPSASIFHDPEMSTSKTKKLLSKSGFDDGLASLDEKTRRDPEGLAIEAEDLHRSLNQNKNTFLKDGRVNKFINKSMLDLEKYYKKFTQSDGWKQIFLDILNALIFIASFTLSYWATGRLRIFSVQVAESGVSKGVEGVKSAFK